MTIKYFSSILIAITLTCSNIFAQIEAIIPSDKPKLVVGIVIEQTRKDYIEKYWDNFDANGIKKLINNGSYFHNANYNYSLTQTAPGHATIVTGAEPSEHGIVSNYWYNPLTSAKENCIIDQSYQVVGDKHATGNYSPENIQSSTFSDEAKLFNQGKSKVISVSLDPYGAILSGGYSADAAYWFDSKTGKWVTSSYYMPELPKWVEKINHQHAPKDYLTREWTPLLPIEKYNIAQFDSSLYEFGINGSFKSFPYVYENMMQEIPNYELMNYIPEGNTHTTDLAIGALYNENLGTDDDTDFLFINYSVSENIGKLFGPQSIEIQDLLLRLDKNLAHLISVLEETVGKQNTLIYLTSNHGISEVPQYLIDNKMPAGHFKQHHILALLNSYLKAIYDEGEWVLDFNNNQIYLNKTLIEDSQIPMQEFQEKVISFIVNSAGISNAIGSWQFQNIVFIDGMPKKMQNSFNQKRSGDIMISLKSGWIEDVSYAANHNSGYKYDTNVPLVFYGWKIKKQNIYADVNITDIATTISMMLGTPPPPISSGKTLKEIFTKQ